MWVYLKYTLLVVGFTLLLLAAVTTPIWQPLLVTDARLPVQAPYVSQN